MSLPYLLRCLGRPQLVSPAGEPVKLKVRKHLALLVYLALEDARPHRRDHLAELLWPRLSAEDGRHSLATAVSLLRGKLGRGMFPGNRDTIHYVPGGLAVDLERLASGKILGDEVTPPLEIGGFLEDFDLADAPEFNLWRERQRARWIPMVRDALVVLIDRCRRTGDFRRIEPFARTLLEIDELSEDGIRARMEARAFDGDRVSALKIFQAWKAKLAEELGASPSPLLEGMALRLRQRGWETTPVSNIPTVPTDQWRGRPFVGRAREYETLYNAWESTCRGEPRHVLILGDSGIGKSTLMERMVTAAGLEGAAISRVQCYELEREIPYAALTSLIEGLLDRPGAAATPPEWLAELSRTVPEVRRRFPGIPESIETQGESARIRLTDAFQQLVQTIAEEHPVILVVDDVHLADDASLAVLHLVMRRGRCERTCLVMAARTNELGQSPHAAAFLNSPNVITLLTVELQPLPLEDCTALLEAAMDAAGARPPHAVRRALLKAAAGFPMVLEYLLKDWQINGQECLALSMGAMTDTSAMTGTAPGMYSALLERVTQRLGPTTHLVLGVAAILGPRLSDISFYNIADVSTGQTMVSLSQLTAQRVLRDGIGGLGFANELIRAEAYLSLPSGLRTTLHSRIADQLLSSTDQTERTTGLEVAWHLIRSGRTTEATPYLLSGARTAIDRGAPYEAERAIDSAMPHLSLADRCDALLLKAEAENNQGKWASALRTLSTCDLDDTDPRHEQKLFLSLRPRQRCHTREGGDYRQLLREYITIAESDHPRHIRLESLSNACILMAHNRDPEMCAAIRAQLEAIPGAGLSAADLSNLAISSAMLAYQEANFPEAINLVSSAINQLEGAATPPAIMVHLYSVYANVLAASGKYDDASGMNLKAFDLACNTGYEPMAASIASNLVMCCHRTGQHDQAVRWASQCLQRDAELKLPSSGHGLYHAAMAAALLGNMETATRLVSQLEKAVINLAHTQFYQGHQLYMADCQKMMGQYDNACSTAAAAVGIEGLPKSPNTSGMFARWLAELAVVRPQDTSYAHRLDELMTQRGTLDRLDRTEVLAAKIWLGRKQGRPDPDAQKALLHELAELPKGALAELRALGFIA